MAAKPVRVKTTGRPKPRRGLKYAEQGAVATITLSRPDKLNALTFDIYAGLRDYFAWFRRRKDLGAVVLTGEGRGFCSGGDVDEIIGPLLKMDAAGMRKFTTMTCNVVANM